MTNHKAGFVNIVGNPNVGKSTLMNQLVGERISIATFKAQTTRHRIMGIVNTPDMQIVFSDTPGVLKPNYKLQESMLAFSESALTDADVLLHLIDLCLGDVQPQLFLGLGQRDPQPAPCGKFMIGRKEEKHFPAGIAAAQRRFIAVLAHGGLLYTHK